MALADGKPIVLDFIPHDGGILDTIFHKTWLSINVLGIPNNGCTPRGTVGCGGDYTITLIGLIIIFIIAYAATAITKWLTGAKPGGTVAGILITLFGAFLVSVYVRMPSQIDVIVESVHLVGAFIGAIIVAVFYVLIRNQVKDTKAKG